MLYGHDDAISAYKDLLSVISTHNCAKLNFQNLLMARDHEGLPAFLVALQMGRASTICSFAALLARIFGPEDRALIIKQMLQHEEAIGIVRGAFNLADNEFIGAFIDLLTILEPKGRLQILDDLLQILSQSPDSVSRRQAGQQFLVQYQAMQAIENLVDPAIRKTNQVNQKILSVVRLRLLNARTVTDYAEALEILASNYEHCDGGIHFSKPDSVVAAKKYLSQVGNLKFH